MLEIKSVIEINKPSLLPVIHYYQKKWTISEKYQTGGWVEDTESSRVLKK